MEKTLTWEQFEMVDLRVGNIVDVQDFSEARRPTFKLWIDFGKEIGVRKSSAQIRDLYTKESLMGKQIMAVVNFPPKQIGTFMSECLVTGFVQEDGSVVLAVPDKDISHGSKLS